MGITLRPLTDHDVEAHNAGEDDQIVRWLSGGRATAKTTRAHFALLAANALAGHGKRGFGVWLDDRLAGYVDCDPGVRDGLAEGDVNLSYAVHGWARGRGVAGVAVRLMCDYMRRHGIGERAAIRVDPGNRASVRVAEKGGFGFVREFVSGTDKHADGTPATLRVYVRDL